MNKRNIYILIVISILILTGCKMENIINNKKQSDNNNIEIPKRGDYLEYSEILSKKEYKTPKSITGIEEEQLFQTDTNLKWIIISNESGVIRAIADKNIVDSQEKGLGLNNESAYISAPGVLNVLSNTLYSTKYATARSVKVSDIVDLMKKKSSLKNKANKYQLKFTNGTFYKDGIFKEATTKNPIIVKSNYYNYSLKDNIELENIIIEEAMNNKSSKYNKYQYWLADSGIEVHKEKKPYVIYGIHKMTEDKIILHSIIKQDEKNRSTQETYYLGVRPIIEIKNTVQLQKVENESKNIWKIKK